MDPGQDPRGATTSGGRPRRRGQGWPARPGRRGSGSPVSEGSSSCLMPGQQCVPADTGTEGQGHRSDDHQGQGEARQVRLHDCHLITSCIVRPATGRSWVAPKIPGFASPPRGGFALDGWLMGDVSRPRLEPYGAGRSARTTHWYWSHRAFGGGSPTHRPLRRAPSSPRTPPPRAPLAPASWPSRWPAPRPVRSARRPR